MRAEQSVLILAGGEHVLPPNMVLRTERRVRLDVDPSSGNLDSEFLGVYMQNSHEPSVIPPQDEWEIED